MAKVKRSKVTPGTWYVDPDGDIASIADDGEELIGDIVCVAPEEYENSMDHWAANARLLAQAKRMHELIKEAVLTVALNSEWFDKADEVLEEVAND